MRQLLIFLTIVFTFFACNPSQECEHVVDVSKINTNLKVIRLEKELFEAKNSDDIEKFIQAHPLVVEKYMAPTVKDDRFSKNLLEFYTDKDVIEFYKYGEKINHDFPDLDASIGNLYQHVKYYYPSFHIPEVYTIVTGFNNSDYYMDDSLAVISIDYFYGKKSRQRPDEFSYMLERREPEFIVPGLALRLALRQFVEGPDKDDRLIADMINWGKVHYFMDYMMPCAPDSTIIMYTGEQLKEVEKNMDIIWGHFIENKLFYETRPDIKRRYVEESPKISVIGESCPGRIGRYIGWQIVKAYMEKNPGVTLQDLMKEKDALKIFKLSKYKPKAK